MAALISEIVEKVKKVSHEKSEGNRFLSNRILFRTLFIFIIIRAKKRATLS